MQRWRVHYFIGEKMAPGDQTVPPALEALLSACAVPEYVSGEVSLARLTPGLRSARRSGVARFTGRCGSGQPDVVRPGVYDDFDSSISFRGADWAHDKSFDGPTATPSDTAIPRG